MKKFFLSFIFILILIITVPGCYTVIWNPDKKLPARENRQNYNGYYSNPYYYYYYDYPWWYSLPPNFYQPAGKKQLRNKTISKLRNNNGRRNGSNNLRIKFGTTTKNGGRTPQRTETSNPGVKGNRTGKTNGSNNSKNSSNKNTHDKLRNNGGGHKLQ